MAVTPFARAITLCDSYNRRSEGKLDLLGAFDTRVSPTGYPYTMKRFCIAVHLVNGLGRTPFFIDIRHAGLDKVVWTVRSDDLNFPDRMASVRLVLVVRKCRFPSKGVYILDLFCGGRWVCDTRLVMD